LWLALGASAGEYHNAGQLVCSDCHIQHASKEGQSWTPTEFLLKSSGGEVALCLSCHDGTDSRAPDIVASGTSANPTSHVATPYASKYGSSAGFFQSDWQTAPNPFGHGLSGEGGGQAPLSSTFSTVGGLRCSNCHDPHGTPNYRNLLSDPNPAFAGAVDVLLGTDVREIVPVNPDVPNAAQAYDAGNIAFYTTNRINTWCTDCHDQLASATVGSLPAHFMRHPVGVDLSGANYRHVNTSNWISGAIGASTGFGTDLEDAVAGVPRLRYGSPSGSNSTASTGDTVLCLTCHKAHGSKYRSGLVWPFRLDASDSRSGCQQCHYQ